MARLSSPVRSSPPSGEQVAGPAPPVSRKALPPPPWSFTVRAWEPCHAANTPGKRAQRQGRPVPSSPARVSLFPALPPPPLGPRDRHPCAEKPRERRLSLLCPRSPPVPPPRCPQLALLVRAQTGLRQSLWGAGPGLGCGRRVPPWADGVQPRLLLTSLVTTQHTVLQAPPCAHETSVSQGAKMPLLKVSS